MTNFLFPDGSEGNVTPKMKQIETKQFQYMLNQLAYLTLIHAKAGSHAANREVLPVLTPGHSTRGKMGGM